MNSMACLPQLALPAPGRAGFPLQPGHEGEVAFGSAVVKSGSCSEGNGEVTVPASLHSTGDSQQGSLKSLLPLIRKEVKYLGY